MTTPSPLRILLLVSNPLDAEVNIADDVAALERTLRQLTASAEVVVCVAEAEAIKDLLTPTNRAPFQVLHYLGHGYKAPPAESGFLILEDQTGHARAVSPLHLAFLLAHPEFSLAILTACYSVSVAAAFGRVPHIVAIDASESVYEIAAVQFYRRFYQTLLTGGSVAAAFAAGRSAVVSEEQLARLGEQTPLTEAAKFALLPSDQPHDQRLGDAVAQGSVQIQGLPRLTRPPFNRRPAHFVGRNRDLQALLRYLRPEAERGVLVMGASGAGKTELAKEVAHWLVARRRVRLECSHFVNLVNTRTVSVAISEVARAVGLKPDSLPTHDEEAAAELAAAIPPATLLILDEAENLIAQGGRAVRDLLETLVQAPARPLLIVTSQSDVGSAVLPVYRLPLLSEAAAFELFAANARLTAAEWAQIKPSELGELLGYVDRLPRAIELLAREWRYRHTLDLEPLLAELRQRRIELLQDRRYPDEVKSVVLGVELAYTRLRQQHPAAATLYAHLALFPGGLSEAGVTAIFGAAAARQLAAIEDQSLLERPWPDLLYQPTPLRFFAQRQLPSDLATVQATYGPAALRYYYTLDQERPTGWVNQLDDALQSAGEGMGALIDRYEAELPSIEAWLDWAYAHEPPVAGRVRGPQLTALLQNLYVVTSRLHHRRTRFEQALAQAQAAADQLGEANTQKALGDLELREDNLAAARQRYQAALPAYQTSGAKLGEANTLQSLGNLARRENDPNAAYTHYRAALEIHTTIHDQLGMGADLGYMGRAAADAGQAGQAVLLFEEAIVLYRRIAEQFSQAIVLDWQANQFRELEAQQAALAAWWQAREIAQAIGLPLAQRLDGLFAQLAQAMGAEPWSALAADLSQHAEAWRQAAIDQLRSQFAQPSPAAPTP